MCVNTFLLKENYQILESMQKSIVFIISFFLFSFNTPLFAQFSAKWGDQGNGTFHNPVLPSDFSDLDAIRVGDDFYAISSTLQVSPGMAVLHSKDLVNWKVISHVVSDLTQINQINWNKMNSYGKGVWAGSIRYYKGKYWVYFGTPEDGFFMSSAKNPAGPWEPLHQVWKVQGWDDCCTFLTMMDNCILSPQILRRTKSTIKNTIFICLR
jgi:beta-xylosidase